MDKKKTIILFYAGVALVCALILGTFNFIAKVTEPEQIVTSPQSGEPVNQSSMRVLSTIKKGLPIETQSGTQRDLKDLEGQVWLFCQFFVDCPQCAQRNFTDLAKISKAYKDHKNFNVVCLSINPEEDSVEKLALYAKNAGADEDYWWFARADKEMSYQWVREQLKFHDIKERTNPAEAEVKGRFAHDMSIAVIDAKGQMRGKFDLYSSKFQNPDLYDMWKSEINRQIRTLLNE